MTFLHYQEFMLKVHQQEHKVNKKLKGKTGDTISFVGNEFASELLVLCIDQFQVLDIADAMILKRLFDTFYANRVLIFISSNRPPEDLYLNGLQRDLFLPFIDDMRKQFKVLNLSSIDYRLLNTMGMESFYYPGRHNNNSTDSDIDVMWDKLTNGSLGQKMTVEVA